MNYVNPSIVLDKDREIDLLREALSMRGPSEPMLKRAAETIAALKDELAKIRAQRDSYFQALCDIEAMRLPAPVLMLAKEDEARKIPVEDV